MTTIDHVSRRAACERIIGFTGPNYRHMAVIDEAVRAELTTDFG